MAINSTVLYKLDLTDKQKGVLKRHSWNLKARAQI